MQLFSKHHKALTAGLALLLAEARPAAADAGELPDQVEAPELPGADQVDAGEPDGDRPRVVVLAFVNNAWRNVENLDGPAYQLVIDEPSEPATLPPWAQRAVFEHLERLSNPAGVGGVGVAEALERLKLKELREGDRYVTADFTLKCDQVDGDETPARAPVRSVWRNLIKSLAVRRRRALPERGHATGARTCLETDPWESILDEIDRERGAPHRARSLVKVAGDVDTKDPDA
jgi:hypothetical protein